MKAGSREDVLYVQTFGGYSLSYKGKVITDAVCGASYKTHYAESMAAGTDYYCWDKIIFGEGEPVIARDILSKQIIEKDDGAMLENVRRAAKNIYYAMSRSLAVNGMNSETKVIKITPWWQTALYSVIAATGVLTILAAVFYYRAFRKKEEIVVD